MAQACMPPPPALGSGEIENRYGYPTPPKPLPWYFDSTKSMYFFVGLISALVIIGILLN